MMDRRELQIARAVLPPAPPRYDSRSEYSLAQIFERHIPHWHPVMGETVQIPILDKRIDFLIQNTLVEFHPILINRELKDNDANFLFRQLYKRSNRFEREQLTEMMYKELSAQYSLRRWQLIQHSEHRGKQFVVCRNEQEVYKSIIKRFSPKPPSFEDYRKEFVLGLAQA